MADEDKPLPATPETHPPREDYTEEQQEEHRTAAIAWFDANATPQGRLCPVCGADDWWALGVLNLPIGRGHPSERVHLTVPIICDNCGYEHLFSAATMGLDISVNTEDRADIDSDEGEIE
jgi:hypothetical protein